VVTIKVPIHSRRPYAEIDVLVIPQTILGGGHFVPFSTTNNIRGAITHEVDHVLNKKQQF
jgi:hypothetical protein